LSDEIKKEGVNLSEDELNIFLRTKKLNYFQKEKFELINIFQKPFNEQDALLEEHAKKYFFIDNSWESTKVLTKNDFRKKLEELKVENVETDLVDLRTNWEKEQEKLQEKHSISDKLMNIFYFFKQLFILRDERKMMTLQSNHYYDLLVLRLSEIIGYPFEKLSCLKIEDLTGNISIDSINDAIEKKKDLFIDYYAKGVFGSLYGNEAKEVYEVFHKTLDVGKTIKGNVASKGIVEGIVRVIVGEVHFSKFNDDEILVAPMTRPEYLPLMKKAKAIITDEGGITCHAAIISRELKIPCIIGTQVATKVLKDGDLVEVNAETGVVKILK
jgi:phosphohistidine swiveling domain-containing protein